LNQALAEIRQYKNEWLFKTKNQLTIIGPAKKTYHLRNGNHYKTLVMGQALDQNCH
jgi:hypothetical protein